MGATVAVFLDGTDRVCAFAESEKVLVFEKEDAWRVVAELAAPKPAGPGMTAVRDAARALAEALGDTRILAGGELGGVAYGVFDRLGFHIFSIDSVGDAVLDGILADVEADDEKARLQKQMFKNLAPVETSTPGAYFLDLAALQQEFPEVSSKKALAGFLKETPFTELRLVCRHIPPWLENGPYEIQSEATGGIVRAVIARKRCEGEGSCHGR